MLKRMQLPASVAKSVSETAPADVGHLYRLSYLQAVALSQTCPEDQALFQYANYFKAEQECDGSAISHLTELLAADSSELGQAVYQIVRGRKILETPLTSMVDIEGWRLTATALSPRSLIPYVEFLAAMAYRNGGFRERADTHFLKSAAGFNEEKAHGRELASHLNRPNIDRADLIGLRSYAQKIGNLKCLHIANFELAIRHFDFGDSAEGKVFCDQAIRGFRYDFLDPRRERIALHFLNKINRPDGITPLENKLFELVTMGPKTKIQLIELLFDVKLNLDQAWFESHDTRFRSLLYRFGKKFPGVICKVGETYRISPEGPSQNKKSRRITRLS